MGPTPDGACLHHFFSPTAASGEGGGIDLDRLRMAAAGTLGVSVGAPGTCARVVPHRGACELFIAPNEACSAHGTGILLTRMMEQAENPVLIRSGTLYGGRCDPKVADQFVFGQGLRSRKATAEQLIEWLAPYDVKLIVCVPYYETELQVALAAKGITGAPMALYVMDDNTLQGGSVNRATMDEAVAAADLRLAISGNLRDAYESAFQEKFWVLPPLVARRYIRGAPSAPAAAEKREAVLIGNVWDVKWLEALRETVRGTGWTIRWYTDGKPAWVNLDPAELAKDGVVWITDATQEAVTRAVEQAPFVVVPYGSPEQTDAVSSMSLPTRIPFVVAAAGTPLLILGEPRTAAARFVTKHGVGEVAPYDKEAFQAAAERLLDPAAQSEIRARAAELGPLFSSEGMLVRIRQAVTTGAAVDDRFEEMFRREPGDYAIWVDRPLPPTAITGFTHDYAGLRRLRDLGFRPDFVLDVGASTGIWSYVMSEIFPDARFVLADPLHSRYPTHAIRPEFEIVEAAISDKPGTMSFQISGDLYNSSLLAIGSHAARAETIDAKVTTVDRIMREKYLSGRGLLKVDVQYAEHLVLAGGEKALARNIDVVLLELTLFRAHSDARIFAEMIALMDGYGYQYFDDIGGWRSPVDGVLEQKDCIFVRKDHELIKDREVAKS